MKAGKKEEPRHDSYR